jgi:hypothetical protein
MPHLLTEEGEEEEETIVLGVATGGENVVD